MQVQSKSTGTSVGDSERLGRAEGPCYGSHSFPSPCIEVEVVPLACMSCPPLLDQCLVGQERSQPPGGPDSSVPSWAVLKGRGKLCHFTLGRRRRRKPVLFLRSCQTLLRFSATTVQSLLLTPPLQHTGMEQDSSWKEITAVGTDRMCLALAQGCNQAGKGPGPRGCALPPTQMVRRSCSIENWLGPD